MSTNPSLTETVLMAASAIRILERMPKTKTPADQVVREHLERAVTALQDYRRVALQHERLIFTEIVEVEQTRQELSARTVAMTAAVNALVEVLDEIHPRRSDLLAFLSLPPPNNIWNLRE